MTGLDTYLLHDAAAPKRVSISAAGIFGLLCALVVLCVEEIRMARVTVGGSTALPLGLVAASSTSTGCQLFVASHYINDQKKFKAVMDSITPDDLPKGVTSHAFLPSADGHTRRSGVTVETLVLVTPPRWRYELERQEQCALWAPLSRFHGF